MHNNSFEQSFTQITGELGTNLGLNRSMGQIYGLLYLSDKPVALDDISKKLKMSKGSVSLNIRELEKWEAVKKIWVQGSRKDFYEANTNFSNVIYKRLKNRCQKIFGDFAPILNDLQEKNSLTKIQKERLAKIQAVQDSIRKIVEILPEQIAADELTKMVSIFEGSPDQNRN